MSDLPNQQTAAGAAEREARLAAVRRQQPNSGEFLKATKMAIASGDISQLQALMDYAQADPFISLRLEELLDRPIDSKGTLILKAIRAEQDGNLLPVETRAEMVRMLMEAGAVPKNSPKEHPITMMIEQRFPEDVLWLANDLIVWQSGLPEGTVLREMKPLIASQRQETNLLPAVKFYSRSIEPLTLHQERVPGLHRGPQITNLGGGNGR